ncbi:nucleoprotein TPR-like [Daphnia carinata]|uniref:nucleoprotein TPR-like n=1 Tax=Daphnia carinata TaxID=120202 RepID=UPI00257E37E7|nr:nucleoprotein TPR-like [Daphnia carinata]XP_057373676.1 nucleoprotein TPR-like [Daphnia carinata]
MATVSLLSVVLSDDEFKNLNDTIKFKLEEVLKKHENDFNQLNIKLAKLQTQSEQQCFELDSQLQQLQDQGKKEEKHIQELTDAKAKVDADLTSSQEQLRLVSAKLALLEASHQEWSKEKESLLEEKENLNSLLSRRNDDLDRLTGELKSLTDQLVHANKEKSEALIKTEELNSQQLALEYKEKRLNQERELIVRQQRLLQDELESRTKEVMMIRREKTSKVLELQADVSEKIEELRIAHKSIGELTATIEGHEKHIKELNDKVKELGETEMKMSENHRNELRSQMRLCELYKASSEDAQAKADELTKATEELQRLLRDASVRFGKLETDSKAQIDQLKDQLEKSSESNMELKKELERANNLLDPSKSRLMTAENIEAMSPSAAAASRLLKSGMTLTQIYSQYVSVSEQMLFKEEENKKLNSYIDQILQELEDRAPTIARQREDHEKSIEMVANLTRQLDLAVQEAETEKENALEARRVLGQAQRNSQRFEKQVADLSKQVCLLIREVEELRGNRLREEPVDDDQVSSSEGSAASVISRHLVTFRDVEELQQKNQMLLTALREVTEKQDAAEQGEIDIKTAKIQQALENALSEVEHLRDTRRRHEELMESVIQQRDMYSTLLQEAGLGDSRSPSKFRNVVASTPAPVRQESTRSGDTETQLNETKQRLEEQEMKLQNVIKEKKERETALESQIQTLQDQLTELRAQNVRLSTHKEYADAKEKLLQGNLDSCKKQLNALEDKNKIYACTVAKHEQSIAILRDEAMNAQQQLARAEVTISMLQEEKQLLKDAEQRLLVERNALLSERRSQSLLHANLESIKLNLERGESETHMRLQNTVTSLEQQIELLRKKLDLEEQRYRETVKSFEDKILADQALLKAAEGKAANAEAQLVVARERLAAAESRTGLTSPTRKGQVTRLLSTTPTSGDVATDSDLVGDLRAQLAEARMETSKYQEQLELVRQQSEQYRSIADSMEEQLTKSNVASLAFKQETEQLLAKLNEERSELARNLQETQDKLKALEEGAAQLGRATAHQSEEVSNRITQLEANVASLTDQVRLAEESEAKARQESLDQVKHAKDAQEKYERELMQHAADVEQLNAVRERVEQSRSQLALLQQTSARLEAELATGRSSWQAQKEMLEKEASEKARRCSDLDKQVDVMQQQIVTLSSRMAAATRCQEIAVKTQSGEDGNTSLNTSTSEEDVRSTDQLLELVRFLRREKEIAISRSEVQEAETQRLKTQLEQAERNLNEAQTNLQQERERSATSALTSEKHTEMLRRLETLNALTDSNRLLRDERGGLVSRVEELTVKVSALEAELEPLRSNNHDSASRLEELSAENATLRKQVVAWRTRTNALQERAGRATADEIKKLQSDKELVQKQLEQIQKQVEQMKEAQTKTANQLTETQRVNTQLVTAQQKLQEEARLAKEESQKAQSEMTTALAKRDEETAKAADQANQLRRIARKYKTQYEELKVTHDKLVSDKEASASAESAPAQDEATSAATTEAATAAAAGQATKIQELEEQIAQMAAELEKIKQDNEAMRLKDEKATNVLKTTRQKLASLPTLIKEKETLVAQLEEARAKIESLEQSSEELNVRSAALRSQLEGRLSRLERENSELLASKQALETELEALKQRIPVLQRHIEAYQKQLVLFQQRQQKQQVQQTTQQVPNKPPTTEKTVSENPPTANIKPMASGTAVTPQRPPVSSSPGQVASGPNQVHRTTPTASIRPMAMTTRTMAVPPTSVAVSPMAPPPIAIAPPNPVVPTTPPVNQEEPVAGPSFIHGGDEGPSSSGEDRSKKRARTTEESPSNEDTSVKRTRLSEQTEEEVEVIDLQEEPAEESAEDYATRTGEMELVIEYEEQPQEDHEVEEEEVEEGLIESEEEEMVETVDPEEEDQEEECDEIVVEEQREDVEEPTQPEQESEAVLTITEEETVSVTVQEPVEEAVVQQVPAEDVESEAFVPVNTNEAASSDVSQATIRPPPREDRLPSFGRNTLAFEDVGDDGIVPSTPVLLRPRTNDGFAEAVSSPQVNTRFVFGTVPELSAGTSHSNAPSHLESQGMEDTRMDLSQLEENSGRSVPSTPLQVSPHDELPAVNQGEEASVVPAGNTEEQGDFEGGPDLEGDAAAEIDLLGEDDQDTADNEQSTSQVGQDPVPSTTTEDDSLSEASEVSNIQSAEGSSQPMTTQASPTSSTSSPSARGVLTRRASMAGFPRGRGVNREDSRLSAAQNTNRPVPITWTPNPAQPAYTPNPARVFRRVPTASTSPAPGAPAVITELSAVATTSPVPPVMRGRGATRGRPRSRAPRRM